MLAISTSGIDHDFFCYDASQKVWNGSAFVDWADGDYGTYRVAATEIGSTGRFIATEPSGTVSYELRERGDSLAISFVVFEATNLDAETQLQTIIGTLQNSAPIGRDIDDDLILFLSEGHTLTINTAADYSAIDLVVTIEPKGSDTDVAKIENGSLTKTASTVAFTIPAAVTECVRTLRYSVRDATTKQVLKFGRIIVRDAPDPDAA